MNVLFNSRTAVMLALASQAVYTRADIIGTGGHGAHCQITEDDDCTVIAFRGTKSVADWVTDAEFFKVALPELPDAKVHHGFYFAIESVMAQIMAVLRALKGERSEVGEQRSEVSPISPFRPLVITGHSLGGALAQLCAFLLTRQGFPIAQVYTFGSPRVGNRAFAAAYTALLGHRTFRLVNQNDIVPRLPAWLDDYRHAGELEFVTATGALLTNPALWAVALSDAFGLWRAYRLQKDVLLEDHFISDYIEVLAAGTGDRDQRSEVGGQKSEISGTQLADLCPPSADLSIQRPTVEGLKITPQ